MNDKNIDTKLLHELSIEITDNLRLMGEAIPEENEYLLKNLAAVGIHLAMFARDIHNFLSKKKLPLDKNLENLFFKECGCDYSGKLND